MRKDIKHALVECLRSNSHVKNEGIRKLRRTKLQLEYDPEEGYELLDKAQSPKKQGVKPIKDPWRKDFGENLSPLRGFLYRSVNQPWDKVYSEIAQACDRSSATGAHIFSHIFDFVAHPREMMIIEGKPYHRFPNALYSGEGPQPMVETKFQMFWIDEHGILRRLPSGTSVRAERRAERPIPKKCYRLAPMRYMVQHPKTGEFLILEYKEYKHKGPWYTWPLHMLPEGMDHPEVVRKAVKQRKIVLVKHTPASKKDLKRVA